VQRIWKDQARRAWTNFHTRSALVRLCTRTSSWCSPNPLHLLMQTINIETSVITSIVSKFSPMVGFCRIWAKNLGFGLDSVVLMNALYNSFLWHKWQTTTQLHKCNSPLKKWKGLIDECCQIYIYQTVYSSHQFLKTTLKTVSWAI